MQNLVKMLNTNQQPFQKTAYMANFQD